MQTALPSESHHFFTPQLLTWGANCQRDMPWKGERNPYLIWLSEIILQQTRVAQGLAYFERFKTAYPTVEDLALAPEDEVLKHWEGLGYYSRARNLHFTAKYIAQELNGIFPNTYPEILKLKGVGAYTAAAIASFAYDLPYAVVDGNVYRVLSRYFGMAIPIDTTAGKKEFAALAQDLLPITQAAIYNQAIMDFGATQCTPKAPDCSTCPLATNCVAQQTNQMTDYPVKSKKLKKRTRYFYYLVFNYKDQVLIRKRTSKDIWQGLYEFPLIELDAPANDPTVISGAEAWQFYVGTVNYSVERVSKLFKQTLSHQYVIANFWEIALDQLPEPQSGIHVVPRKDLSAYAFPKVLDWYFKDNSLALNLL